MGALISEVVYLRALVNRLLLWRADLKYQKLYLSLKVEDLLDNQNVTLSYINKMGLEDSNQCDKEEMTPIRKMRRCVNVIIGVYRMIVTAQMWRNVLEQNGCFFDDIETASGIDEQILYNDNGLGSLEQMNVFQYTSRATSQMSSQSSVKDNNSRAASQFLLKERTSMAASQLSAKGVVMNSAPRERERSYPEATSPPNFLYGSIEQNGSESSSASSRKRWYSTHNSRTNSPPPVIRTGSGQPDDRQHSARVRQLSQPPLHTTPYIKTTSEDIQKPYKSHTTLSPRASSRTAATVNSNILQHLPSGSRSRR
jgi:hypothetical protein